MFKQKNHALRAAINTPIQGGAADIVLAAMVKLFYSQELRSLDFQMILQIHDEIILEGPEENSEQALHIVKELMEHPLDNDLIIKLEVDAKIVDNWYQAK